MKKLNLYFLAILMTALPFMQSCDDPDGYSLGNFVVRMATVRVISGNSYYLEIDNGEKLWVGASSIPWYKPVDGQRTLADFTLLGDEYGEYDRVIKVNFLSNLLTKGIEELTEENEEMFGDDVVHLQTTDDIWASGNYLNVRFLINIPANKKHRVSLVENTTVDYPEDGYVHLEYRYNDQDDVTGWIRYSFVSFNLGDYAPEPGIAAGYKGIKVRVNLANEGEKIFTYDYKNDNSAEKSFTYSNEIVDGAL